MTQIEDALAKATELTNAQRVKTEAALDVFAPKMGEALGRWASDGVEQHLTQRPHLVTKIEDDSELSRIKRELNELLATWPGKVKASLLNLGLMSENLQSKWTAGLLGIIYSATNDLTREAEQFFAEAFGEYPKLSLKRPSDGDFPPSVGNIVQGAWEDFAHEHSNLMEMAEEQRKWARKVSGQEAASRWGQA